MLFIRQKGNLLKERIFFIILGAKLFMTFMLVFVSFADVLSQVQTPLGAWSGLGIQPRDEAPGGLCFKHWSLFQNFVSERRIKIG